MRYVGARDFSSVVFGFCLVFNSDPRGKRPKMCRLSTSGSRVVMGTIKPQSRLTSKDCGRPSQATL